MNGKGLYTAGVLLSKLAAEAATTSSSSQGRSTSSLDAALAGLKSSSAVLPAPAAAAGLEDRGVDVVTLLAADVSGALIPLMPDAFDSYVKPLFQQLPPSSLAGQTQQQLMELYGRLQEALAGLKVLLEHHQCSTAAGDAVRPTSHLGYQALSQGLSGAAARMAETATLPQPIPN